MTPRPRQRAAQPLADTSECSPGDWARIENKVRATRAEQGLPPKVEDITTLHAIATLMRPGLLEKAGAIRGLGGRKAA